MFQDKGVMVAVAVLIIVLAYLWMNRDCGSGASAAPETFRSAKREHFIRDQELLNASTYTYVPEAPVGEDRPDFGTMCGGAGNDLPAELQGMTEDEIKNEIDLHYRKPMEMVDSADLLPEENLSGLSYGADPADSNKFVWHRTTHARLKRRNWEGGSALIRGDLVLIPEKHSWFNTSMDMRDLTPSFINKEYRGLVDVEDLTYNMHSVV